MSVYVPAAAGTVLRGQGARLQLLVTAEFAGDVFRDRTREAEFTAQPANVVAVSQDGMVTPLADGKTTIGYHVQR